MVESDLLIILIKIVAVIGIIDSIRLGLAIYSRVKSKRKDK